MSMFGAAPAAASLKLDEIIVRESDSLWKILESALENNPLFKNLDEVGKISFISSLVNKMMQEPTKFGLDADRVLKIGSKLNIKNLLENEDRLKAYADKAIKLTEVQKKSVLENNKNISTWITNNPDKIFGKENVSEILSPKPKVETKIEPKPEIKPEPAKPFIIAPAAQIPQTDLQKKIAPTLQDFVEGSVKDAMGPKRMPPPAVKPGVASPMPQASRSMAGDASFNQSLEAAFNNEIDQIYGKKGLMGLRYTPGAESKEWMYISKLPAKAIFEYFTGDSSKSGLPAEITGELAKTESHYNLMKQLVGLINETQGVVKPDDSENVESFVRRLGAFVMKEHMQEKK